MRITNAVGGSFSVVAFDKEASSENQPRPSGQESRDIPKTTEVAVEGFANESGDRKLIYDIKAELERKGMEISFRVDPSSGRAQMVVVESGTQREVLKVPSDSALYQILDRKTQTFL
jgi:uncharacterized FlaG/YvyC family protein